MDQTPKTYAILPLEKPLRGSVNMPGSKSYSNRALIMASLAPGVSVLDNVSAGDDTEALIAALRQLGVSIEQAGQTVTVAGNGGQFAPTRCAINVGAAGTTMRFLTALCALVPGEITLDGSARMRERPLGPLLSALRELGVDIKCAEAEGFPPLLISGGSLRGGTITLPGSVSSQYITALLLVAPALSAGLVLNVAGTLASPSYIAMTVAGLKSFGIKVEQTAQSAYRVPAGQNYRAADYNIEGDASGASYFWALAALTGSTITVENIDPRSVQGDVAFADILEKMGCIVSKDSTRRSVTVAGPEKLRAVKVDMADMPDTAQTLAVLAAFAEGETAITGLSTLKIKETDRLLALRTELAKMGVAAEIGPDYIKIRGGRPRGAMIDTYHDHRMAMAFAIAGAKIPDVVINDPAVVSKSFPDFWKQLQSLGVEII